MRKEDFEKPEPRLREHRDCLTLTGLTLEQLPRDHSIGRSHQYLKGSFVWTADSSDHSLYFLERGQIVIMLNDDAGCELIVRMIGLGEPFGELCFCSERDRPRNNCAQASVDSAVVQIGFDDFMLYLVRDADALRAFAFTVCQRLADAEGRIEVLSHRGAEARLGRLLLQLAAAQGLPSPTRAGEMKLLVGHDELSRMAAMTRSHVSVTMGKLRTLGLVHYGRGSHLTIDVARLHKYMAKQKTSEKKITS